MILRDVLSSVTAARLCMDKWMSEVLPEVAYCAAVWAALDDRLKKEGFILRRCADCAYPVYIEPCGQRYVGLDACQIVFQLTFWDTVNTFMGSASVTPEMVIANIDRLLAGKCARPYCA
jgi:hypothetical protein